MADVVDDAAEFQEKFLEQAINSARAAVNQKIQPTGKCLWCEEKVAKPKLFCCVECNEDYHKNLKRRK